MEAMATTYEGDCKVFTCEGEWVIARDAEDAKVVYAEMAGEMLGAGEEDGPFLWTECPPEKVFTLTSDIDGSDTEQPFAEFAKRGRGYLASANY
jgi:hypothetical protein